MPPKADGSFDSRVVNTLHEIGSWLSLNGAAIYKTRPWTTCCEDNANATRVEGGWPIYNQGQFRLTTSARAIFVTAFGWPAGGSMLVHWPRSEGHWDMPATGHIDGYGPGGWSGGFMLGATAYLEDVEDEGGGFVYWPQSHITTHQYFLENPSHIDGSFTEREDWKDRSWGIFSDLSPQGPEQFTAQAGDVIFWHCFLCHTGSTNIQRRPRLGLFSRWHHTDREQMRYDVAEDLWKYWAI